MTRRSRTTPERGPVQGVRAYVRAAMNLEDGQVGGCGWPEGVSQDDFVAAALRQRVVQVLGDHAAELALPREVATRLLATRDRHTLHALAQVAEVARAVQTLEQADVDVLTFKGPALSLLTTGRLEARGSGDLDLLVDPSQVAAAHAALSQAGWLPDPTYPVPGSSWGWRWALRGRYELPLSSARSAVDLHWRLDPTRQALPTFGELWSRRRQIELAGTSIATLGVADTFVHTCSHAAMDDWRWLRSLVDIHRLARDPEMWAQAQLRRVDVQSLAVTQACVGLPHSVPSAVLNRLPTAAGVLRRARASQERPVPQRDDVHAPGAQLPDTLRRSLRGSRAPSDVALVTAITLLPATSAARVPDRYAVTAVPRAALSQVRHVAARFQSWSRDG